MTGEIEGWQVLLVAGVGILPTVYIGLLILTLATWINSRDNGRLPAQLFPNRHTYFPYSYTKAYKVSRFLLLFTTFFCVLPFMTWLLVDQIGNREDLLLPMMAVWMIFGATRIAADVRKQDAGDVECVVIDPQTLTIKYRVLPPECYKVSHFAVQEYINGEIAFPLVFKNEDQTEAKLWLKFLGKQDKRLVAKDLETLQKTGALPGMAQNANVAAPIEQGEAVRTKHMAANAKMQQRREKREEYYADPANYARHLQRVADKLPANKKADVVKYMEQNEKARAVAVLVNQTGCAAKEAKDIVENYRKYLLGETTAEPAAETPALSLEELAQLQEDPAKYAAYLKEQVAKLSAQQKATILQLIRENQKIQAIKECREALRLGLKEAKDIVDNYETCLLENDTAFSTTGEKEDATRAAVIEEPVVTPALNASWTLRVTDDEQVIQDERQLRSEIDRALTEVAMCREEFLVLAPSEPVCGITFLQVARDANGLFFHIEAGTLEKNAQGRPKIMCRDGLMSSDVMDLCAAYYLGEQISLTGWYELQMT